MLEMILTRRLAEILNEIKVKDSDKLFVLINLTIIMAEKGYLDIPTDNIENIKKLLQQAMLEIINGNSSTNN